MSAARDFCHCPSDSVAFSAGGGAGQLESAVKHCSERAAQSTQSSGKVGSKVAVCRVSENDGQSRCSVSQH